jgi:hypothetical protein
VKPQNFKTPSREDENFEKEIKKMKRMLLILVVLFFVIGLFTHSFAQFTEEEVAEWPKWEEFLKTSEIVNQAQPWGKGEAVTDPWELTLEKDGITHRALWKNPMGRQKGYVENWKHEIAAYRFDRLLGLNMIPPTVEKRFQGSRGSCQLYAGVMSLADKEEQKLKIPSYKLFYWNRAIYLHRTFDNLIANEDRHQKNFRITDDWRLVLIDHSRSFRTSKSFTSKLIYTEKHKEGPKLMKQLPQVLFEKLKGLNFELIEDTVGEYLTDKEINAVLVRRDLIVEWLDTRIEKLGEAKVLY